MISLLDKRRQIRRDRELQFKFKQCFRDEQGLRPEAIPVLAWMKSFCFANQTALVHDKSGAVDMYGTAAIAGRQEVWQEFNKYLSLLTDAELVTLDRWLQDQQTRAQEPITDAGMRV